MKTFPKSVLLLALLLVTTQPLADPRSERVLVEGAAATVTVADFERLLQAFPPDAVALLRSDPEQLHALLDNLYVTMATAAYAERHQLEQHPTIAANLWRQRLATLSSAALQHYVENKADVGYEVVARERYLVEKERFQQPEELLASHILMDVRDEEPAERLAELRKQILAEEISFEAAAREHSRDRVTAQQDGSLGWFHREQMVEEFSTAAFALQEKGEISEPVESPFGFHIIRLEERKAARQMEFDEVKAVLMAEIREEHAKTLKGDFIEQIRREAVVHQEAIQALLEQ